MSTQHPSPEKLSNEDAHSPSTRTPLIQGNLTMWRGGFPGEVLGERRFFRLWDKELVHYECDALQCKSDFETVDLTQASIYMRRMSGGGGSTASGGLLFCEVRPRHCAEDSFILKATTTEEMQRWVLLMQQQSQHHRENDRILLFEQVISAVAADTSDIQELSWASSSSSAAAATAAWVAASAASTDISPTKAANSAALPPKRAAALRTMSTADLKRLAVSHGIDITGFIEKDDFLRALVALGI